MQAQEALRERLTRLTSYHDLDFDLKFGISWVAFEEQIDVANHRQRRACDRVDRMIVCARTNDEC